MPFTNYDYAKKHLQMLMGVSSWRPHDLRRTATTLMAELGIAPHVADKVLNHTGGQISGAAAVDTGFAYLEERGAALAALSRFIATLIGRYPATWAVTRNGVTALSLPIDSASAICGCVQIAQARAELSRKSFCYHCGREIAEADKRVGVLVIESHTGRIGSAHLHCGCCDQSLSHYKQTVTWDGSTISNLQALKQLHNRLAGLNRAAWGAVPVVFS